MKKIIKCILFLYIISLTACGAKTDFPDEAAKQNQPQTSEELVSLEKTEPDSKRFPLPQTAEIFLIDRYVNWAEGYFDRGLFVDTTGAVYAFDFGGATFEFTADDHMFEMFDILRDNTDPVMVIDNDTLAELYSLGLQIAPESIFQSECVGFDGGSSTVSFRNPDTGKMEVCIESGDYEGKLDDRFAEKLVELYNKTVKDISSNLTKPVVYTAESIHMSSFECDTEISGKYFLAGDEQLRSFARQIGVSIDDILNDYTEYEWGRYVYFVELNAAPANAILCIDDSYKFSHMEGSGFCNVAAYPPGGRLFVANRIPCADGDGWQRINDEPFNWDIPDEMDTQNIPEEELIQKIPKGQRILFINFYEVDGELCSGFFIDNQGNKVDFVTPPDVYGWTGEVYPAILELDTPPGTEYMSLRDLAICYDNLLKIENYTYEERVLKMNESDYASYYWYGVIERQGAQPQFIYLSSEGAGKEYERINSDEHAKEILKILFKYQNSEKEQP